MDDYITLQNKLHRINSLKWGFGVLGFWGFVGVGVGIQHSPIKV